MASQQKPDSFTIAHERAGGSFERQESHFATGLALTLTADARANIQ
jgi:hypothetical protein